MNTQTILENNVTSDHHKDKDPKELMRLLNPPQKFDEEEDESAQVSDGANSDYTSEESMPENDSENTVTQDCEIDPGQYGYVPCYRTFQDEWFWKNTPWDIAHLFIDLLMKANRKPRKAKHAGKVHTINRGQLATSQLSLAEITGRDRKTVVRWLRQLQESGELTTKNLGQSGILVTICKYEGYALDHIQNGQPKKQHHGHRKGQHNGQQ